ncbi:MAG: hypothetical protein P4L33_05015 [Capsulimonadaceae bacterium]|nr:hypothetical protein [Capsulimonadaceae bacterium]
MTLLPSRDRTILRGLAAEIAELAARPIETEKRRLWYDHNALKPTRPLVFCDPENGWHEIIRGEDLQCVSDEARGCEWQLRREIFWGRSMCDDRVIEPFWNVGHVASQTDWGLSPRRIGGENGGSFVWDAPIKSYDQLHELRFPTVTVDWKATNEKLEQANELFCGILPVRLKNGWHWTTGLTSTLANLRGLEQLMVDMLDEPDNLHRLMAILRDGTIARLESLEQNGLLTLNNDGSYVGSGGFGWTRELPADGFDGHVRLRDLWCLSESQETVGVSPGMFAEFVLPYQLPIINLYGLSCYGCCEALDLRWKYIKEIPNLRRVSVSPWSDRAVMADNLQDKYVYSMKPNPADLAMDAFPEERIRETLRHDLEVTRGCHIEVIMKDCHTIGNDPSRAVRWTQIARGEAERLAG